jgi:hypothetical protein
MMPATAVLAAGLLLASACGGTLEGKYRRGEITTTATTTTATTTPSSGNAAGQRAHGEPERRETDGTIVGSATRRTTVSPLGGRHR